MILKKNIGDFRIVSGIEKIQMVIEGRDQFMYMMCRVHPGDIAAARYEADIVGVPVHYSYNEDTGAISIYPAPSRDYDVRVLDNGFTIAAEIERLI